jgi:hypothetical protein
MKKTFIILIMAMPLLAAPFLDNSDGTVTDITTGLVWQKCSKGQTNDPTCSGIVTTATWQAALEYCETTLSLAGRTWRLPSVNELNSIVDTGKAVAPFIDTVAFPATPATIAIYFSASTYVAGTTSAWSVDFTYGSVPTNNKAVDYYVRCVSGP